MGKRATIIDLIGEQRKVLNQKKAEKVQGLIFEPKNQPDTWGIRCDVCDLPLSSKFQMAEHLKGNRHKVRSGFRDLKSTLTCFIGT